MLELILGLVIGVVVGWHFPQPEWAKKIFAKVKGD